MFVRGASCSSKGTYILKAGRDWSTLAMSQQHLYQSEFEIFRIEVVELFLRVRRSRFQRSHGSNGQGQQMGQRAEPLPAEVNARYLGACRNILPNNKERREV